jgi:hypothetical protein
LSRRIRHRKPTFTNIRVTDEQANWIKNQRHQGNEPIDSVMQRVIIKTQRFDKEHPEMCTKNSIHYVDDRMAGILVRAESSDAEVSYDWMRHIRKYEKGLNLEGDNPYELITNLRISLDKEHQRVIELEQKENVNR